MNATNVLPSDGVKADAPRVSYFWAYRSNEASELRRKPNAFALLHLICERVRYCNEGMDTHGLKIGEAFVGRGDRVLCGLSEKEYRSALKLLERWRIVSLRVSRDRRGTIVTLRNRAIFDAQTGFELSQQKGQPITERNLREDGQPKGQQKGEQRASKWANKGPLTNKGYKANKENSLTVWEAGKRIAAIDREIGKIKSIDSNFIYEAGQKRLKEEPREQVKQLRAEKDRAEKIEAGLQV